MLWAETGYLCHKCYEAGTTFFLKGGISLKYLNGVMARLFQWKDIIIDYDADGSGNLREALIPTR